MSIKLALILLLQSVLCLNAEASAQTIHSNASFLSPYKVHPLYLEDDPAADYTFSTIRDQQGFLWIATDNGLKRYDGYQLRTFSNSPNDTTSIGSKTVTSLHVLRNGQLWAGGTNLNRYNASLEIFSRFNITNDTLIRSLHETVDGMLWLGGDGFGLIQFDPTREIVLNTFFENSILGDIQHILPHSLEHQLWIASSGGLFIFNTQTYAITNLPLPLTFNAGQKTIRGMSEDQKGNVWIATQQGLIRLDSDTYAVKHYTANATEAGGLKTNKLSSIFHDSRGRIWIGTDKQGVHRYNPESDDFLHIPASISPKYTFPKASIEAIYEDKDGSLWFSVGPYGVHRISKQFETFSILQHSPGVAHSLSFNNVTDLLEDQHGDIWIGTAGQGLDRYNPLTRKFQHYTVEPRNNNSLSDNSILSLAEDTAGNIWIGTEKGGLNRLTPSTGEILRIQRNPSTDSTQTLASNTVGHISVVANDQLLLGVWPLGLQIYNTATGRFTDFLKQKTATPGDINNYLIHDIVNDNNKRYWIAGTRGLELFDTTTQQFSAIDLTGTGSPIQPSVYDLHEGQDSVLWLASHSNLIRYSTFTEQIEFYNTENGLSDDLVMSIEEDHRGHLWLGTRFGLNRFHPGSSEFLTFTKTDGLAGSQFNLFSHLRAQDGSLYFGGTEGISFFNPAQLISNEFAPNIHITEFELFQNTIAPHKNELLPQSIIETQQLTLKHNQNDLTFGFSALNFIFPANNHYQYRLKGLEQNWVDANSRQRRVRYTNLSPGDYIFQVLGSNNDGMWAGRAREISITILPAWWQTWWTKAIAASVILLCMYLFSYWRLRSNRIRERELTSIVNEKTAELKQANRAVLLSNAELEQRVKHRTRELSIEIEERKVSEAKSRHIAYHDTLTELPNRSWLIKHLKALIKSSHKNNHKFALLFLGGDRFKQINDNYGYMVGDKLLVESAYRIGKLLSTRHHITRVGSDEFAIVIDAIDDDDTLLTLTHHVLNEFDKPFKLDEVKLNFYVSIGILVCSSEYSHPDQIFRNANIALRKAKEIGRGTYQMFDSKMLEQTLEIAELESDLKSALYRDQFRVVFQPIITIETGAISCFEILLRWEHPSRGLVPPVKFIPIAETLGTIFSIGQWVFEQACEQIKTWDTHPLISQQPMLAVNLSPIQLSDPEFLNRVDTVLGKTGIDPSRVKFEITESAIMENTKTVDSLLEALRAKGIELAIDDFGTGYSSLSYLDKLPVQQLKIDRSFINALTEEKTEQDSAHEIVRATISLAHNLNMSVVAEGIENQEQLKALASHGCDYGQGYLIAKPLSAEGATTYMLQKEAQ
ncbi:EAL domain-containing protein [Teredinibacter purpureus]|uniref:EAL domain-containing protein n=1 Tax=Teredinibacter purpureus TaxID=2731756 RepID=UPI0006991B95|nr:EAL domain-containing protein [Teredinibacter purpureus]